MKPTCSDCDVEAVQSERTTFNVIWVCPECDKQLACALAKE